MQNVFEELDTPGEFYFDADAKLLYLWYNGTGQPPTSNVVVPHKQVLVNASGSQWAPVKNVKLSNIKYAHFVLMLLLTYSLSF